MEVLGHKYLRAIYAFEFKDKSVYVGLTSNYSRRKRNHLSSTKSILRKIRDLGDNSYKFRRFNIWYPIDVVGEVDARLIEKYRRSGWQILNKAKPGGLGSSDKYWTKGKLVYEAKKYKTIKEFRMKGKGAYGAAIELGIIELVCSHMKPLKAKDGHWTKAAVRQEAKKYTNRTDFKLHSGGAFNKAKLLGVLEEICTHMTWRTRPQGFWTKSKILKLAKDYSSRTQFQKANAGAYDAAVRLGLIGDIQKIIPITRKKVIWTEEKITQTARKFNTKIGFKKKYPSAYAIACRKKILKKVFSHIE